MRSSNAKAWLIYIFGPPKFTLCVIWVHIYNMRLKAPLGCGLLDLPNEDQCWSEEKNEKSAKLEKGVLSSVCTGKKSVLISFQ